MGFNRTIRESNKSRANPQAAIVYEEQLVPSANILKITKNNQRVALDSNITDTLLKLVVRILKHRKLYKPVSSTATMPPLLTNKPYTKPLTEKIILAFIKTLGYDEDPKVKMTSVSTVVATKLHQPLRVILGVINRSLTGKDTSRDYARLPVLQILWGIIHSTNLNYASLIWEEFEWQAVDRTEGQDSPFTKLINNVDGKFKFRMEIPITMITNAIKQSAGYMYYKHKKDESEKGKGYMCSANQVVNVPCKPRKAVVLKNPRTLIVADNIVKETLVVELAKPFSIEEQQLQHREIMTLLTIERQGSKESRLESIRQERQVVEGEGSSADHNKYYEFEDISATKSDATRDSSCSDTDEDKDDETVDSNDSDMDLSDDKPNKGDDDATGFGNLLNEAPIQELTDLICKPVYTYAHTTFKVANLEEDLKLETLSSINVSEAIKDVVQDKVMTEIKKQLSSYVPTVIAKFVKPHLNNSMELKLKLLNRMYQNKSNETHDTHQKLYNTLYESITLDQESLDAQDIEPSFNKRKSTWFDMLLKSNIDQNEDHILGSSTEAVAKKLKALIKKDKLTIADLEVLTEARWSNDEGEVSKPRLFEKHMFKSTKPHSCFYNNDFYYLVNLSMGEKDATSLTKHFAARYHLQDARKDFFKEELGNRSLDKVYSDKRIIYVVHVDVKKKWGYGFLASIMVRRSDKKEYEFSYADLSRLILNDVEDMYLLKIPYTMGRTEKGIVYLNQYNIKSLMNISEVNKLCDCKLLKIHDNLLEMVNKNELGPGNKRLKGKYWRNKDIKRSSEILEKIDKTLKHREQLRRLEEYVGGRPKTFDPRLFVNLEASQGPINRGLREAIKGFSTTNKQNKTLSNPRNQATIQDGRVTIQQVQGRQTQSYAGTGNRGISTTSNGNYGAGQPRTEDLDAYDLDCDDLSSAKAVLMANLSSCDPEFLSEVPYSDSYPNDMINQDVQEMQYSEQTHIDDFQDNEIHSDSNIILYSQYLQESQDAVIQDTNSSAPNDLLVLSLVEQVTDQ
ncbi:hypothetical protein Tco_1548853 [Tanacetum coccineum]